MSEYEHPATIPFEQVLKALLDESRPFDPRYLHRLSDLEGDELEQFAGTWPSVSAWRRKALLEDLEQLFESDSLLSFDAVCRLGLRDESSEIRFLAVRSLFEYDLDELIPVYLEMLEYDDDSEVRGIAATILGRFVYRGECGKFSAETLRNVEDALLRATGGDSATLVRRRSLESLGYSSRKEIPALIEAAHQSGHHEWIASALCAMGRSYEKRWEAIVEKMLNHVMPTVRFEAARAAGELEIVDALDRLFELIDEDEDDVRSAAIWSISQIGGDEARTVIEQLLDEVEDDKEAEFLESALDNLIFNEGAELFGVMGFPDLDEFDPDMDAELDEEDFD